MTVSRESLQELVARLETQDPTANLFFLLRERTLEGVTYIVQRSRIEGEVADGFIQEFKDRLSDLADTEDLEVAEYDPEYMPDRKAVEVLNVADVPPCQEIIDNIQDIQDRDNYATYDEEFFSSVWAYCVRIQVGNSSIFYFRKYSNGKVVRADGVMNFILTGGAFNRLEGDVFYFDANVDCFVTGDEMVVVQKTLFEQIFSYVERYAALATMALDTVTASGLIANVQEVAAACMADSRKIKKLAAIQRYLDPTRLDFHRLKAVATDWNIQVGIDDVARTISVEKRQIWGFLKLLGDDLLRSPLTDFRYVVTAKRRSR